MKLKQVRIQGFKSFADNTVIQVEDGITSVIGPNGSGKSNIVDAIRWVLGEQSVKSLRGSKSTDVIFSGTKFRKSLGFAKVSILFDNTDKDIPIDFEEVEITRTLYRDGESAYYINKAPAKLKTIQELFLDTGIGKDGYSIIGQGKIDEILSNNQEQRRKVFEQATGISKFKERRKESLKNIDSTNTNIQRVDDILNEVVESQERLAKESKAASQYIEKTSELKALELRVFKENAAVLNQKEENLQKELEKIESISNEVTDSIDQIQAKKDQLLQKQEEIEIEISKKYEGQKAITQSINELQNAITIDQSKIAMSDEYFENTKLGIEKVSLKKESLLEEVAKKQEKIDYYEKEKQRFQLSLEELSKELASKKAIISDDEQKISKMQKDLEAQREKQYELEKEYSALEATAISFKELFDNNKDLEKDLIRKIDAKTVEIENMQKSFEQENKKLLDELKEKEAFAKEFEQKENELKQDKEHLVQMEKDILVYKNNIDMLNQLEKEKDGFSFAVKNIISSKEKNELKNSKEIIGTLSSIINVKDEYFLAIETALGYNLQNIIVENENIAKQLIDHLKTHKWGRATFLPINKFGKGFKYDKQKTLADEVAKLRKQGIKIYQAKELLTYDKRYEDIINSLLSSSVVTDTMESALKIKNMIPYVKIITKDGSVIAQSGSMTGGYSKNVSNILGRKEKIKELEAQYEKAKQMWLLKKKEIDKNTLYIETQKVENDKVKQELANQKMQLELKSSGITHQKELLLENQNVLEKTRKEKEDKKEKLDQTTQKLNQLQEQIDQVVDLIANLQEQIDLQKQSLEEDDNVNAIEDLQDQITNVKISIESFNESKEGILEMKQHLEKEIQSLDLEIAQLEKNNENQTQTVENLKKAIQENEEKLSQVLKEQESMENLGDDILNTKKQLQKELEQLGEVLTQKQTQKSELLPSKMKLEQEIFKIELERENYIENIWNSYEITLNNIEIDQNDPIFEKYNLNEKDTLGNIISWDIKGAKNVISKLKQAIKNIGPVNLDSIEEFEIVNKRYTFLTKQKEDLELAKKDLEKTIKDITKQMKVQFETKMEQIDKNFEKTFKELFGGGTGKIQLLDPQNPLESDIDIQVEPPGKKLQNMSLLSGGERAFTAIAILFAILNINPSPFCILDEIEAALDDVNVYRFSQYLKNYSQDTQFLVITHRKGTMEIANIIYGITMEENGVSKVVSLKMK